MYSPFNYYGGAPQQPVVFIPSPGAPQQNIPDIDGITRMIAGLEALKKVLKEDNKDGGKKDDKEKKGDPRVFSMMLLMILCSPVIGPIMSAFFAWGRTMMATPVPVH